jgi:leucyl/phenylalanyl-tRNA--protein transferase
VPVYFLDERIAFPPPDEADESGLLAVGGDLSPERLVLAYSLGIFPWYSERQPILWHAPDPRTVLEPAALHVPRSLAKRIRRGDLEVRLDTAFEQVMERCAKTRRPGQRGTWITRDMRAAYARLHAMGLAHSAEAWQAGKLVGGLYGVSLGAVFYGESMFAEVDDASKIAFVTLVAQLRRWGFTLIDCQQDTPHLTRFGAVAWPRARFQAALAEALTRPTRQETWRLDAELARGGLPGQDGTPC